MFLVEKTIVWGQRADPYGSRPSTIYWPALNFKVLVDRVGLSNSNFIPLEFFNDKHLLFLKKEDVRPFEEDNPKTAQYPAFQNYPEVKTEVDQWLHEQQVQHILMQAPYSLTGYRVQVYRLGSTTQWFSAVITGHDLYTRVSVGHKISGFYQIWWPCCFFPPFRSVKSELRLDGNVVILLAISYYVKWISRDHVMVRPSCFFLSSHQNEA